MGITRTIKTIGNKILRYNTFDSIVIVNIIVTSTYMYIVYSIYLFSSQLLFEMRKRTFIFMYRKTVIEGHRVVLLQQDASTTIIIIVKSRRGAVGL